MNRLILFFIFFIAFTNIANSEVINNIQINGNKRISDETVKIYGGVENNKNYTETDLNKILQSIYSTNFFKNVEVKISNKTLIINLEEHPVINQLIIVGEKTKNFREQIKKTIFSKQKGSYIKSFISEDIEKIKNLYSSIGYNSAKVDVKIRKIDEQNLDLVIEVLRGNPTKISSIKFIGDKKIRDRRLRDVIASEESKFWKIISRNTKFSDRLVNLDLRLLRNYYRSIGYYDVKINSNSAEINKESNIDLIYSIDAGKRYVIKKISTNVDSVFDKNIFLPLNDVYGKYIGDYYSPFKIKKLLESLDDLIEKNNLQFVEHNVKEIVNEDGTINVTFNVFEGEKLLVERINVIGNTVTNEDVIRSELILDEGDPFTKLNLDKSISNIRARNIFKNVNYEIKEGTKKDLKIIDISVEETPTGEISAGAGVGTNGGNIAFTIKENNWFGRGQSVLFAADIDQESVKGTLSFTDPNFDKLGNSLNYFVSSETNDKPDQGYENTIFSTGVGTSFDQYKDIRASLGLSASFDDLRTDTTASDSLKKQSGTFSDLNADYSFSYDLRNRSFRPTDGSFIKFGQTLPVYADKPSVSNLFTASFYEMLSEDIVGSTKFLLTTINSIGDDDVRLSKRKTLSTKRLRGFERNKIGPVDNNDYLGGNYAASLNFDANLPNLLPESTNTDVSLFLDFGNVWGVDYDSTIDDSNKIRSSTGIAVNWMSPIGPMNFVIAENISKASTDKTQSFNFNLGTTF